MSVDINVLMGIRIGRITAGLLSKVCSTVDIVEPVAKFTAQIVANSSFPAEKIGDIYNESLENWTPTKKYDLIWNQWCLGHLTDTQLVSFLERCGKCLSERGWIIVKENMSTDPEGGDIFDEVDSSVTRF